MQLQTHGEADAWNDSFLQDFYQREGDAHGSKDLCRCKTRTVESVKAGRRFYGIGPGERTTMPAAGLCMESRSDSTGEIGTRSDVDRESLKKAVPAIVPAALTMAG